VRHFLTTALVLALVGCQSNGSSESGTTSSSASAGSPAAEATAPASEYFTGPVVETMNAGGYTYVQVDTGSEKIWAAGPQQEMEVGTEVTISKAMPMPGFRSETLERTFDTLYFVSSFDRGAGPTSSPAAGMPETGHGEMTSAPSAADANIDLTGIEPADQTVAALYEDRAELAGKTVRVRGKVIKALPGIMGTNWLHVQDGTGSEGQNDLTVTSDQLADVGATVVVEGVLGTDRDFGAGYRYDIIIENASVEVE
jgi:hypothetical protein